MSTKVDAVGSSSLSPPQSGMKHLDKVREACPAYAEICARELAPKGNRHNSPIGNATQPESFRTMKPKISCRAEQSNSIELVNRASSEAESATLPPSTSLRLIAPSTEAAATRSPMQDASTSTSQHEAVVSAVRAAKRALQAAGYDIADLTVSRICDSRPPQRLRLTIIDTSAPEGPVLARKAGEECNIEEGAAGGSMASGEATETEDYELDDCSMRSLCKSCGAASATDDICEQCKMAEGSRRRSGRLSRARA
jgi:hypothetical protein